MPAFMISFDLNREGSNYSRKNHDLTEKIKEVFPFWWHNLDSTWVVVSEMSAAQIRDVLSTCLDSNDELLVVQSAGVAAWKGFTSDASAWLKENI
jgi:hypothetical protein